MKDFYATNINKGAKTKGWQVIYKPLQQGTGSGGQQRVIFISFHFNISFVHKVEPCVKPT